MMWNEAVSAMTGKSESDETGEDARQPVSVQVARLSDPRPRAQRHTAGSIASSLP